MTPKLFGTDGIRGVAGEPPLVPPTIERIGWAIARSLANGTGPSRVFLGRDTRESGPEIESALARGLVAGGAIPVTGGVLPTPAVAWLTKAHGYRGGVVLSASHNPYQDNGIKVFAGDGCKLSPELESAIESLVGDPVSAVATANAGIAGDDSAIHDYLAHLRTALPTGVDLDGVRIVVDCANGAASHIAPRLLTDLGADVIAIGHHPNGRNINDQCGALHTDNLAAEVVRQRATLGIAYDGDADRCILIDENGAVRDGDDVLAIIAAAEQTRSGLRAVVTTVMANFGLERYLRSLGLEVIRTAVGDKYVVEEMRRQGIRLGGEQSGHVVFLDHGTTGDGILTSLKVLREMRETARSLASLSGEWQRMPQVLRNVRVRSRVELATVTEINDRMTGIASTLGDRGRMLVRYSGTEPLVRIMLEGPDQSEIDRLSHDLAESVERSLA